MPYPFKHLGKERVRVNDIKFNHDSISPHFKQSTRTIHQLIHDLVDGKVQVHEIPPIQVVRHPSDGALVCIEGHRRLACIQEYVKRCWHNRNHDFMLEVEMVDEEPEDVYFEQVEVRGGAVLGGTLEKDQQQKEIAQCVLGIEKTLRALEEMLEANGPNGGGNRSNNNNGRRKTKMQFRTRRSGLRMGNNNNNNNNNNNSNNNRRRGNNNNNKQHNKKSKKAAVVETKSKKLKFKKRGYC